MKISKLMTRLDAYLRYRAEQEGVGYDLTPELLQQQYDSGVRSFFGVQVEYKCMVKDGQNPDTFAEWTGR